VLSISTIALLPHRVYQRAENQTNAAQCQQLRRLVSTGHPYLSGRPSGPHKNCARRSLFWRYIRGNGHIVADQQDDLRGAAGTGKTSLEPLDHPRELGLDASLPDLQYPSPGVGSTDYNRNQKLHRYGIGGRGLVGIGRTDAADITALTLRFHWIDSEDLEQDSNVHFSGCWVRHSWSAGQAGRLRGKIRTARFAREHSPVPGCSNLGMQVAVIELAGICCTRTSQTARNSGRNAKYPVIDIVSRSA